jgi:hypothetical protein
VIRVSHWMMYDLKNESISGSIPHLTSRLCRVKLGPTQILRSNLFPHCLEIWLFSNACKQLVLSSPYRPVL